MQGLDHLRCSARGGVYGSVMCLGSGVHVEHMGRAPLPLRVV